MLNYNKPRVYVIVCKDLSPVDIVVQSCHAALEAGIHKDQCKEYPASLVVLKVSNEDDLIKAGQYLKNNNIQFTLFYENPMKRHTALATEVIDVDKQSIFKKFQLLDMGLN